jgi:hypothetical protein
METCTITRNLEIVPGTRRDYESLSSYHYREHNLGPYAAIYAIKGSFRTSENLLNVGVIVYAMPATGCQMRSVAIPFLSGLDRITRLKLINANIRTISRVIIEPRFRSLGLAARLVSETMPLMNVPFIEALAVMGQVNPFFEKAGMTRIDAPPSPSVARLIEAFAAVGIDRHEFIDPILLHQKLDSLSNDFIERELTRFLQAYGQRRLMPPGLERTKFILSKLTDGALSGVPAGGRPVYYFWKNPNRSFGL